MIKKYKYLISFLIIVFTLVIVSSKVQASKNKGTSSFSLPEKAQQVAPAIYKLGLAVENGKVVEGYAYVHYKEKEKSAKPGTECDNGICEPGENVNKCPQDCSGGDDKPDSSTCYGFLAKGARWKAEETYVVNASNSNNLSEAFVVSNLTADIQKWESAANFNILGPGLGTNGTLSADTESPDNKNEVYFADISEPNAIGVTIVWGVFGGPPFNRELVEWDQVYDDVDFDWSASGESGKMDFENIATHELGHSMGLDDLYNLSCSEATMYGYASLGETKKRTLEAGDINGIKELYR